MEPTHVLEPISSKEPWRRVLSIADHIITLTACNLTERGGAKWYVCETELTTGIVTCLKRAFKYTLTPVLVILNGMVH